MSGGGTLEPRRRAAGDTRFAQDHGRVVSELGGSGAYTRRCAVAARVGPTHGPGSAELRVGVDLSLEELRK